MDKGPPRWFLLEDCLGVKSSIDFRFKDLLLQRRNGGRKMSLRRAAFWMMLCAGLAAGAEWDVDAHYPMGSTVPQCPLGKQALSVDGSPAECMSEAQYDWRMLADRKGVEFLAVSRELCEAGNRFDCMELVRRERGY